MSDESTPSIHENAQRLETLLRDNKIAPEVAFELIRQTFGDDAAAAVMEGRAEKDTASTQPPKQLSLKSTAGALSPLDESLPEALKGIAENSGNQRQKVTRLLSCTPFSGSSVYPGRKPVI